MIKIPLIILVYCISISNGFTQATTELNDKVYFKKIMVNPTQKVIFYLKDNTKFKSKIVKLTNDSLVLSDTILRLCDIHHIKYRSRNQDVAVGTNLIAFFLLAYFAKNIYQIYSPEYQSENFLGRDFDAALMGVTMGIVALPTIIINLHIFRKTRLDATCNRELRPKETK